MNFQAKSELGKWRLNVETKWLSFAKLNLLPLLILRLSGIYGLGRSAFDRINNKSFKIVKSPNILFSRIHIDDISSIIEKFIDKVYDELGGLDVLINNAGITQDNLLLRMKEEEWSSVLNLNLNATAYLTQKIVKGMIKRLKIMLSLILWTGCLQMSLGPS